MDESFNTFTFCPKKRGDLMQFSPKLALQGPIDTKSALVQVMHYLSQWWPSSTTPLLGLSEKIRHDIMMTSSDGSISALLLAFCEGISPVTSTKASDAELWYFLWFVPNELLIKQSWGCWFETPSRLLWRHCNAVGYRDPMLGRIRSRQLLL